MRTFGRWIGRLFLLLVLAVGGLWLFGPREPVDLDVIFEAELSPETLDAYFAEHEAQYSDIVPGTERRVVWAGEAGAKTDVTVLYVHGFSATSEEIRPVPDRVAEALGANLIYARLSGHGRSGEAMAEPEARDWMYDTLEALEAARTIGSRVIVMSTSTGGTLMAAAALRADAMENVAGLVFVSPNFAINSPASVILTWPAVEWWGPLVAGAERSFETLNEGHAAYWTNSYPTVALMPMAALVKHVDALNMDAAQVPALFMFSEEDQVVSPQKTREVAGEWGGASELAVLSMGPEDDPYSHVIAGDILSPGQTEAAAQRMITWAQAVLAE
jgi:pimeloyl-ACP methyl ester carboxylesterase